MRMSRLVGRQIKEVPKDATTVSHQFLLRGGYVRPVSAGIYSLLPLGKRVASKVEAIIREEMNAVDGQEVLMPVVLPRELWEESGRYESVGDELLRFQDRNEKDMLLGMTHEEAVVAIARTELTSYKQLPAMLYQIQTKYRDEARPRAGLIRVREFTMKDAYSFHSSEEDLKGYYDRVHAAYERIFERVGMKHVVSIEADSGMMGGAVSHEFMAVTPIGEDTIFLSPDGTYRANKEVASTGLVFEPAEALPLEEIATPDQETIEEVATFLGVDSAQTAKAVFFQDDEDVLVFALVRGDFEVNEGKLRKVVQSQLRPATEEAIVAAGAVPGYASTLGVNLKGCRVVVDPSVAGTANLVAGANKPGFHVMNFNAQRDLALDQVVVADIVSAREGDPCPVTGEPLIKTRGVEVGNIFQLGTKYSAAMGAKFLDVNGKSQPTIMGCYGIGVGRAFASVLEQSHDDYGPVWPASIAPYHVHIVALNYNKQPIQEAADALYSALKAEGIEVLLDDRNKKAGFAFSDADLIGAPWRVVISPRTLKDGEYEFRTRDGQLNERVAATDALERVVSTVKDGLAELA